MAKIVIEDIHSDDYAAVLSAVVHDMSPQLGDRNVMCLIDLDPNVPRNKGVGKDGSDSPTVEDVGVTGDSLAAGDSSDSAIRKTTRSSASALRIDVHVSTSLNGKVTYIKKIAVGEMKRR